MNDFDQRLMNALAETPRPADEQFVSAVAERVDALESVRRISLLILTVAALCLAAAFGYGLFLIWNAAHGTSRTLVTIVSTATPLFSIALAAMACLLLPRIRSRE